MDFYQIKQKTAKKGVIELYPDFKVGRSKDLMVRGKSFYAIWDEQKGLWSTDESDVQRMVDADLMAKREEIAKTADETIFVRKMSDFSSSSWLSYKKYINNMFDNNHQLDCKLTFQNTEVVKKDYVSKRLGYSLEKGKCDSYEELISTLYSPEEREKLEWAIGAVVSGDSVKIQKFIVLYGEAGTGKSTVLNIIQKLFEGYCTTFEAKALASNNNQFSTEVFKTNPLVAIQHDGDLSRIEDNTKLNSIVSHEEMTMNEKYKPSYSDRINCFLFMGTNKPVKITDAKSGIIRRLIDVHPTGKTVPNKRYNLLMDKIDFELGAIAYHCLGVYQELGKNYYSGYRPVDMMMKTDVFYNFVEAYYPIFEKDDGVTLKAAYEMYKQYCDDSLVEYKLAKYRFREELKNYFDEYIDIVRIDGKQVRNYYRGFLLEKFVVRAENPKDDIFSTDLKFRHTTSIFDKECANCPAQYASKSGTPMKKWDNVKTVLSDLDTTKLHYVKVPENHIVIDFDIKDAEGNKSFEKNLEAASKWPSTYAELSKSGAGIHLHYIYDGDVTDLSRIYDEDIEVKVFTGNASLRRMKTKTNGGHIATIKSGLPLKGAKQMVNFDGIKDEQHLRNFIRRCIAKEHHGATKPEIDFIFDTLTKCYNNPNIRYDVSDMYQSVLIFAANSTNNADYCLKVLSKMPFKSEEPSLNVDSGHPIVFFDVEVFPNLFVVVWKTEKGEPNTMINPTSRDIENLVKFRLVGFNNRRYDNHILYARLIGYTNEQLFHLSQKIVGNNKTALFSEAYNLSYTDIYDFASAANKMSLKKWEIKLGIHHLELGLPWDQPVPEEMWDKVAEYCINDVVSTQALFEHLKGDWTARKILAELSGLTVNDTTNQHTTKLIVGGDKKPQSQFVYTDLSKMFPGYIFERGVSTYRGEKVGEGGYVYAEPGMYGNVALLDIASMHPTSIEQLNLFGDTYTKNFSDIKQARLYIKHKDFASARKLFGGKLEPYLEDESTAKDLANALKTAINSVYGLTSAKFDNKLRDPRNIDNIVAKRGALFMIDLKHEVQKRGYTVAHIKTDSIKIPDATQEIIDFVMEFGKKYGYIFEHEATYDKMCLVNDAVYIARYSDGEHKFELSTGEEIFTSWTATGAQFQQPYVFKSLFSKDPIKFKDMCETKTVSTALYLDMNEGMGEDEHVYHFVGKAGQFCPILPGKGGGLLMREKDGKYNAATGTKGYRWLESENVMALHKESDIDKGYYRDLVDQAVKDISKYGDFEWFVSEDKYRGELMRTPFDERSK